MNRRKGFTLFEVLVTVAIVAVVFTVSMQGFVRVYQMFYASSSLAKLHVQSRQGLQRIVNDLRRADARAILNPLVHQTAIGIDDPQAGTDSITFQLPDDTAPADGVPDTGPADGLVVWSGVPTRIALVAGATAAQNQIVSLTGPTARVLVPENVLSIEFVDFNIDPALPLNYLRVVLTLRETSPVGRPVDFTATAVVALRN